MYSADYFGEFKQSCEINLNFHYSTLTPRILLVLAFPRGREAPRPNRLRFRPCFTRVFDPGCSLWHFRPETDVRDWLKLVCRLFLNLRSETG